MIKADFKIDNRFKRTLQARYQGYELKAGILEDRRHKAPLPKTFGLASLEGGPARKKSKRDDTTVAKVGENLRKVHNMDYLRAPVRAWRSMDMKAFRTAFMRFVTGKAKSRSQAETTLRAVIRNPILKGKYGRNSRAWARVKGFNRKAIDTGQFYRAITAMVRKVKKRVSK